MPRRLLGEGAVTVMSRALGSGDLAWGPREPRALPLDN